MYSYGMFPLINQPTRITINSQTTIDNIFISNLEHIRVSGILTIDITDHLPIFTIIKNDVLKDRKDKIIYKRVVKDTHLVAFRQALIKVNWELIFRIHKNNGQDLFTAFYNLIKYYFNLIFPVKEFKIKTKKKMSLNLGLMLIYKP
jgi:hypothetical protein